MENTILSIIASLLLAALTALFTYLATRSKIRLDLTAEYDKDLRTSRLKVYQDLWKLLDTEPHFLLPPSSQAGGRYLDGLTFQWYTIKCPLSL